MATADRIANFKHELRLVEMVNKPVERQQCLDKIAELEAQLQLERGIEAEQRPTPTPQTNTCKSLPATQMY